MAGNTSTPGATVTSRALALLGAFDEHHRRLTLTELAARAGAAAADRAPAGRRARRPGARWPATPTGEYAVGRRLWDLGLLAPVQTGLRELASPYLHDLYGATLATVHLAVRDGRRGALRRPARRARVGAGGEQHRLPAAAARDRRRQGAARARARRGAAQRCSRDLTRITPYTITQPGLLRRQLAPGAARRLRDHDRGDEPRRLLDRGADPPRARRGRRARHRACPRSRTAPSWSARCRSPPAASAAPSARRFRPAEAAA